MGRTKEQAIADFKFLTEECNRLIETKEILPSSYWSLCSSMHHLINSAKEVMSLLSDYKRSEDEELEVARHLVERLECNYAVTALGISLNEGIEATFRCSIKEKEKLARDMIPRKHPLDETNS